MELDCDFFVEFVFIISVRIVNDLMKVYIDFLFRDYKGDNDGFDVVFCKIWECF